MPQNSRKSGPTTGDRVQRDRQQIQDDNQTSGESVVSGQTSGDNQQPLERTDSPNYAANRDPAEGARDTNTTKGGGHA